MALQDCTLNLNRTGRNCSPMGRRTFPVQDILLYIQTVPGMWFPRTGMRIWKLCMLSPDI